MDALISKADALRPVGSKSRARKGKEKTRANSDVPEKSKSLTKDKTKAKRASDKEVDKTASSIAHTTALPRSLRSPSQTSASAIAAASHIRSKKLRLAVTRSHAHNSRASTALSELNTLTNALAGTTGIVETDGALERTWRVGQDSIVSEIGAEAASQRREWVLDNGPYRVKYTRNGRHMVMLGRKGHLASFDWRAGTLHAEIQLRETCRDVTYLHDQTHLAVAQSRSLYIYDQNGVELHKLSTHLEPTRLEFLPFHWLLASTSLTGHLRYQDTSTGALVAQYRTGLGPCTVLAQNPQTAVLSLGHQNGCVTLWTPNLPHPAVRLLAHRGPLSSIAVDPRDGERYFATSGVDGMVKVWDTRMWKSVREWASRSGGGEVAWSQTGVLAVASGGTISTYLSPHNHTVHTANPAAPPPLYLTHPLSSASARPITSLTFCPFTDVLAVGHARGASTLLIPGSGTAAFDSSEADPFENRKMRREREVRSLLDKISPEMITVSGPAPGELAPPPRATLPGGEGIPVDESLPFARRSRLDRLRISGNYEGGNAEPESGSEDGAHAGSDAEMKDANDTTERKTEGRGKKKMRGKNKSMKRYLRKHRKNVIDPQTVAVRAKLERQRLERERARAASSGAPEHKPSVLDRFRRNSEKP